MCVSGGGFSSQGGASSFSFYLRSFLLLAHSQLRKIPCVPKSPRFALGLGRRRLSLFRSDSVPSGNAALSLQLTAESMVPLHGFNSTERLDRLQYSRSAEDLKCGGFQKKELYLSRALFAGVPAFHCGAATLHGFAFCLLAGNPTIL